LLFYFNNNGYQVILLFFLKLNKSNDKLIKICGEYAPFTPQIWEYVNGRICLKIINKDIVYFVVMW